MTKKEAQKIISELRGRFDAPFSSTDKDMIERLYREVLGKNFVPTSCQQCYHDALIEIYSWLKKGNKMAEKMNYRLKAGAIINCPDFYNGKIFTNDNLTDTIAGEYIQKYPKSVDLFQKIPDDVPVGKDNKVNDAAYKLLSDKIEAIQKKLDDAKSLIATECKDVAANYDDHISGIQEHITTLTNELEEQYKKGELNEKSELEDEDDEAVIDDLITMATVEQNKVTATTKGKKEDSATGTEDKK